MAGPLAPYLRDVARVPLLTAAEERAVAVAARAGDADARDRLIRANLRLVVAVARKYQGRGMDLDDLISEGHGGLIRAADLFDPAVGVRFSTYATYWIRQAIVRGLRDRAPLVRVPVYLVDRMGRLGLGAGDAVPGDAGLTDRQAEALGAGMATLSRPVVRLGAGGDDAGFDPGRHLPDGKARPPPELAAEAEARARDAAAVDRLLSCLDDRWAEVVRARFGLGGREPETLDEVGSRFGITRERVRQIEAKALERLRELAAKGIGLRVGGVAWSVDGSDDGEPGIGDAGEAEMAAALRNGTAAGRLAAMAVEVRADRVDGDGDGADGADGAAGDDVGTADSPPASPLGRCPDCGKPYGKYRRCYTCKPTTPGGRAGTPKAEAPRGRSARSASVEALDFVGRLAEAETGSVTGSVASRLSVTPAPPIVPESPVPVSAPSSSARREAEAILAVVAALEALDPAGARRVAAWAADRFGAGVGESSS